MSTEANRSAMLFQWQKDFRARPRIYFTMQWFEGALEDTGNFYDSKEAAEVEAAWMRSRGRKVEVHSANIHNMELSQRRWNNPS